jgi:glycosyltransferase involved in cell wall biosynthesis
VRDSMRPAARDGVEVLIHGVLKEEVAGCEEHDREATRRELGVRPGELLVTTVANYRSQKAYDDMLLAARYTLDAGVAVRFVAVGFGPLESQVRSRIARLCLEDSFDLLGYRDDVPRLLNASDVFALASIYEGGPIVVLEAMAAGVPVVVTAVGFVPEVVSDGLEGFVLPPGRPDLLAARIVDLASDEPLRRTMGNAARLRGRSHDVAAAVARLETIYSSLRAARHLRLRQPFPR